MAERESLRIYGRVTVITIVITAAVLIALELGGRAFIWLVHGVPGKSYGIHRHDPILKGRLRENSYNLLKEFNNLAFQSTEDTVIPKPEDVFRIVTYGGSTTICFHLPTGQCWPMQLQKALRERGFSKVEVLNAGDAGWSLSHAYQRARTELPRLTPDVVVLYSGFNEARNAIELKHEGIDLAAEWAKQRIGVFSRTTLQADALYRNSIVYKAWLVWAYKPYLRPIVNYLLKWFRGPKVYRREHGEPRSHVVKHYLATLDAFIDLIHQSGGKPLFLIQAANPDHREAIGRAQFSRKGAQVAGANGAVILDTQRMVRQWSGATEDLFIETGIHLSATGAASMGRFLAAEIDWSGFGASRGSPDRD